MLLWAVEKWFQSETPEIDDVPIHMREIFYEQSFIGWRQLFNGRMATKWATAQQDHLRRTDQITKTRNGIQWTVSIIEVLWNEWFRLWSDHNDLEHGSDNSTRNKANRRKAEAELKALYELREHYVPSDQDFLCASVEEHLEEPTHGITQWLNTFHPVFHASM